MIAGGVRGGGRAPARRRADDLDADVARRVPACTRRRPAAPGSATSTGTSSLDFCLGDTGAMAGHSPAPVREAVARRYTRARRGDHHAAHRGRRVGGGRAGRRFGVARWSFTLTATDANRWAIRVAAPADRAAEDPRLQLLLPRLGRRVLHRRRPRTASGSRAGNVGAPVDLAITTRVAEFNDVAALERELAHGDVAAVLMEPALTNIGIVLPETGYLARRARADPGGTGPCLSTTRRTRSAPARAAAPRRGAWNPTW